MANAYTFRSVIVSVWSLLIACRALLSLMRLILSGRFTVVWSRSYFVRV